MSKHTGGIPTRVWGFARALERHWLRPLLQRLRTPRFRRLASRRSSAATDELLVALLRSRLRDDGRAGGMASDRPADVLPAVGAEVDALVHGLLATVSGAGLSDADAVEVMTFPIGTPATAPAGEGLRRAA